MDLGSVNWLAVIVCVVVALVSGFIWYHPKVFFPAWWEGIGKAGEPGDPNPMIYVFTLIAAFVQAISISFMLDVMGSTTAASGALAGTTVALKDNIFLAGVPLMSGSSVFEGFVPDEDATVATRVLDAGAEILGKAVCENLCLDFGSHTAATGPVRNPHDPTRVTGGS